MVFSEPPPLLELENNLSGTLHAPYLYFVGHLRPKSFRLIRPFYRVPVFLLGRPSKLPSVLYTLRGWH